jgi:Glycosyl hydrolases family 43/Alpha-L-arabinofuranosidase B (ABFB) domain
MLRHAAKSRLSLARSFASKAEAALSVGRAAWPGLPLPRAAPAVQRAASTPPPEKCIYTLPTLTDRSALLVSGSISVSLRIHMKIKSLILPATLLLAGTLVPLDGRAENPIVTDVFTADPAALVHGDTVYIYAGQDEAPPNSGYHMHRWLCYSSKDMKTWKAEGSPLAPRDFSWSSGEAWASQVIEKNGKFYWYVSVEHKAPKRGKSIGVAVSDKPTGPFKDARGSALITADMTSNGGHGHEDIDPTVLTDTDGTTYLFWGNTNCFYAKLKPNMTALDGPIVPVSLPLFTEAPWIHKRGNLYYLSYATYFPEKIAYATAPKITGPWTYRGILTDFPHNSNTIHQAIIEFKGQWYFVYHNGALPGGDGYRRSVCIDYLYYNPDGTMRRVVQTKEGMSVSPAPPTTPEVPIVPAWIRLQPLRAPNLFLRHSAFKGVFSPSPIIPYMDSMWQQAPGLADAKGVSFETLNFNFPGHFLRTKGTEVVLEKNDNSEGFKRSATFLKERGLADATCSSFRVTDAPGKYLRQSSGALRVGTISSPADKAEATFRIVSEGGDSAPPPERKAAAE